MPSTRRPVAALAGLALIAFAAAPALAGGMPPGFEDEDAVYNYDPALDTDPFADPYRETIGLEESGGDVTTGEMKVEMRAEDALDVAAVDEAPTGTTTLAIIPVAAVETEAAAAPEAISEAVPQAYRSGIVDHR